MRLLGRVVDALGQPQLFWTRLAILGFSLGFSVLGILFVHSTTADDFTAFPSASASGQIAKLAVGLAVLVAVLLVDYRVLERLAWVLYGGLLLVLGIVLVIKRLGGDELTRWISVGFLNIQPSELMKVIVVLALARYLRYRKDHVRVTGLVRPFVLIVVPMVFVVLQPDLGTSLMLPPILVALLFVANANRVHLVAAIGIAALLFPAILLVHEHFPSVSTAVIRPYQMNRLIGFVDRRPQLWSSVNYQLRHSLIALGSGGIRGKGYGEGTQNRRGYLPAKHTDFIFAVIGEELGFVGAGLLVVAYLAFLLCLLRVAVKTREPFARLVVVGIATLFAAQGFENFGMTLGITPITGIPLPFVSYGGSSLVTSLLAVGIVLGIASRQVLVVASPDLNPVRQRRVIPVMDDHPAGANRFPNSAF